MKLRTALICLLALMLPASRARADAAHDVGKLLTGSGATVLITELTEVGPEVTGVVNIGALTGGGSVQSGYVILRETLGPSDSTRWSDVVIFTAQGHKPTNTAGDAATFAVMVSDTLETGITDADLARITTANPNLPLIKVADINAAVNGNGYAIKRFETAFAYAPCTAWRPDGIMDYTCCTDPDFTSFPGVNPRILIVLGALLALTGAIVLRRRFAGGSTPA